MGKVLTPTDKLLKFLRWFYVLTVGTSTIPHLSLPSEDEEEEVKSNDVWEYASDILFQQSPLHHEGEKPQKVGQTPRNGNYGTILPMEWR